MGPVGGEGLWSGRGKGERGRKPLPGGIGRLVSTVCLPIDGI